MQNVKTVINDTISRYLESRISKLCAIVDQIQRLIENINKIMSGEKTMKANQFV